MHHDECHEPRQRCRSWLRLVAGLTPPQRVFRRRATTEQCIEGRTPMITRRNFVKASATSALAAGLPLVSKLAGQTGSPEMNPTNTFWPNGARMVISISMQMEGGAQPASRAESPMPKIDPKHPDLPASTCYDYGF